jgi:hypothetical protein
MSLGNVASFVNVIKWNVWERHWQIQAASPGIIERDILRSYALLKNAKNRKQDDLVSFLTTIRAIHRQTDIQTYSTWSHKNYYFFKLRKVSRIWGSRSGCYNEYLLSPCSPLKVNRLFGGTYCLHVQGRKISGVRNQRESRWQVKERRLNILKQNFFVVSLWCGTWSITWRDIRRLTVILCPSGMRPCCLTERYIGLARKYCFYFLFSRWRL